jgi:hypothetical protein
MIDIRRMDNACKGRRQIERKQTFFLTRGIFYASLACPMTAGISAATAVLAFGLVVGADMHALCA